MRVNVEDEKGKVKVWKGKNDSLHSFSLTRKRIYPLMIVILGYSTDDRCKMKLSLDIESNCIEKIEKTEFGRKTLE